MNIPKHIRYLVVGAGVHEVSTAYHFAIELKSSGTGSVLDIVILDKSNVGAGTSGIACGVIRNSYFQSAMRKLMVHSVKVWESNLAAYSCHSVGYIQAAPDAMPGEVYRVFAHGKNDEWEQFNHTVTGRDVGTYLDYLP